MNRSEQNASAVERFGKPALLGAGTGALAITAQLAVIAALMAGGLVPGGTAPLIAIGAVVIGALAAGFFAARFSGENGMLCGVISGIVLFLLIWVSGGIIGVGDAGLGAVLRLAEAVLPAAVGGVLGVNSGSRKKI